MRCMALRDEIYGDADTVSISLATQRHTTQRAAVMEIRLNSDRDSASNSFNVKVSASISVVHRSVTADGRVCAFYLIYASPASVNPSFSTRPECEFVTTVKH